MGKLTICIGENKGADQFRLCFRYTVSTIPLFLNPKFPASNHLLRLCNPVCAGLLSNCQVAQLTKQLIFINMVIILFPKITISTKNSLSKTDYFVLRTHIYRTLPKHNAILNNVIEGRALSKKK